MDNYCIGLGYFLDQGSSSKLYPLVNPYNHTYHCLGEAPPCAASGYTILADPTSAGKNYTVAYQLDAEVTAKLAAAIVAKCNGPCSGSGLYGFRTTLQGIDDASGTLRCVSIVASSQTGTQTTQTGNSTKSSSSASGSATKTESSNSGAALVVGFGALFLL